MAVKMNRLLATLLMTLTLAGPAQGIEPTEEPLIERITSDLSRDDVPITATFTGSEILVFGAIERSRFFDPDRDLLPDLIIAISGPDAPVIVRRKARVSGIWANADSVLIAAAPAYYAVSSNGPIEGILSPFALKAARISLEEAVYIAGTPFSAVDPEAFRQALIRIRMEEGLYKTNPTGVDLQGASLFSARFALPPNLVEGTYSVRVLLAHKGRVIDEQTSEIEVHKGLLGEFVYRSSRDMPLLFGLAAVLMALFAGWSASAIFRWFRP